MDRGIDPCRPTVKRGARVGPGQSCWTVRRDERCSYAYLVTDILSFASNTLVSACVGDILGYCALCNAYCAYCDCMASLE